MFKKATRKQAKLRLALSGPSGSGKTTGALLIAKGLGGKIAVLDTERGSASLYSDQFDFDVVDLEPPYTPERYIDVITAAEKAGYDILIIDSMTHEWNGQGGCLELNEQIAKTKYKGNTWSAWNEITPRHRKFVDKVLGSPLHIIATMRSKTDTMQTEVNGRKVVQKVGMKTEQRDGMDYEFTTVLDVAVDGHITLASKDRTRLFNDPFVITEETGRRLREWLNSGEAVKVMSAPSSAPAVAPITPPIPTTTTQGQPVPDVVARFSHYLRTSGLASDKDKCLANLSEFFGKDIASPRDLSPEEMAEYLDAVQSN